MIYSSEYIIYTNMSACVIIIILTFLYMIFLYFFRLNPALFSDTVFDEI